MMNVTFVLDIDTHKRLAIINGHVNTHEAVKEYNRNCKNISEFISWDKCYSYKSSLNPFN